MATLVRGDDYAAISFLNMSEINTLIKDLKQFKRWAKRTNRKWPHLLGMVDAHSDRSPIEVQKAIAEQQVFLRLVAIVTGEDIPDRHQK